MEVITEKKYIDPIANASLDRALSWAKHVAGRNTAKPTQMSIILFKPLLNPHKL